MHINLFQEDIDSREVLNTDEEFICQAAKQANIKQNKTKQKVHL